MRKETAISAHPPTVTNYNLLGHNPRVNINSTDASTNVVVGEPIAVFEQLRTALGRGVPNGAERATLMKHADELESAVGTPATYVKQYQAFMTAAADHMTVIGPFLPTLAQWLSG